MTRGSYNAWEGQPPDQEELLLQIADRVTEPIILLNGEGVLVFSNQAFGELVTGRPTNVEGKADTSFVHPDDLAQWRTAFAKGRAEELDLRIVRTGLPPVLVQCSLMPRQCAPGAIAVLRQESAPAQAQAQAANAYLAAIVESSDDAIASKTLQGIVTSWNKSAERIFGYSAEEMIGQPIQKIFPPDRLGEEDQILARLQRGERVDHFETVRMRKDGTPIDVSVTISPIRGQSGKILGASKVVRVITERKLAEAALRESERTLRGLTEVLEKRIQERTQELENALKEMEGFTYTVSHDLRAPLRAIIANCRLLEEEFADRIPESATRHLHRQADAARRLAQLIDDLLRLSRIGRHPLARVRVDVSVMVREIIQEVPNHQEMEFHIEPGLVALADPILLRIVLSNLLENATKFVRTGVRPSITVGREDKAIFVRDNGIGFDQRYEDRIFKAFERLHRDDEYPGTGIGLANVKRIIERHWGRVWATGRLGEGSTFYFELPEH